MMGVGGGGADAAAAAVEERERAVRRVAVEEEQAVWKVAVWVLILRTHGRFASQTPRA